MLSHKNRAKPYHLKDQKDLYRYTKNYQTKSKKACKARNFRKKQMSLIEEQLPLLILRKTGLCTFQKTSESSVRASTGIVIIFLRFKRRKYF